MNHSQDYRSAKYRVLAHQLEPFVRYLDVVTERAARSFLTEDRVGATDLRLALESLGFDRPRGQRGFRRRRLPASWILVPDSSHIRSTDFQ